MNETIYPAHAFIHADEPTLEILAREMSMYFGVSEDESHIIWLRAAINAPNWTDNMVDLPAKEFAERIRGFVRREREKKAANEK